jgi:hypothetical protein
MVMPDQFRDEPPAQSVARTEDHIAKTAGAVLAFNASA